MALKAGPCPLKQIKNLASVRAECNDPLLLWGVGDVLRWSHISNVGTTRRALNLHCETGSCGARHEIMTQTLDVAQVKSLGLFDVGCDLVRRCPDLLMN